MDSKRDDAGLPWPNTPLRPNLSGPLLPGTTPSSTSSAPTSSPAIPAAAASSSSPDPAGPATYASDPSAHGAQPFPPAEKLLGNIAAIRTFLRSKPSTKCTSRSSLTKIKEENCGLRKLTSEATLEPGNLSTIETFWQVMMHMLATHRTTGEPSSTSQHDTSTILITMDITTTTFIQLHHPHLRLHHQQRQPRILATRQHWQHNFRNDSLHHLLRDPTQLRWLAAYLERWPTTSSRPWPLVCKPSPLRALLSPLNNEMQIRIREQGDNAVFQKNNPAPAGCVCMKRCKTSELLVCRSHGYFRDAWHLST